MHQQKVFAKISSSTPFNFLFAGEKTQFLYFSPLSNYKKCLGYGWLLLIWAVDVGRQREFLRKWKQLMSVIGQGLNLGKLFLINFTPSTTSTWRLQHSMHRVPRTKAKTWYWFKNEKAPTKKLAGSLLLFVAISFRDFRFYFFVRLFN